MRTVKLSTWGNSQGIRIPVQILEQLNLKTGDELSCTVKDGVIRLHPIHKQRKKRFSYKKAFTGSEPYEYIDALGEERVGREEI